MSKDKPYIVNDAYVDFNKNIRIAVVRKHPEFRNKFAYISKLEVTGDNCLYIEFSTSFLLFKKESVILSFADIISPLRKEERK